MTSSLESGRVAQRWRALPRAWRLAALAATTGLALYGLAGFLVVPRVIRGQVLRQIPAITHRPVTLAGARFNPFTLKTTLVEFALRDRDSTPLLGFDTLVVNLSLGSVLHRALVLDEFRLVGPRVVVRLLADGTPAIADLLPKDSTPAAPDTAAPSKPPRVVVHSAIIRAGGVGFVDESQAPVDTVRFTALGASVTELSTLPDDRSGHDFVVTMGDTRITWKGRSTIQPLELEGELGVEGLSPARLSQMFGAKWPVVATGGTAEVHLRYRVDRTPTGALRVVVTDGSFDLRRLAVRERGARADWLRVPGLTVRGIHAQLPERTASIGAIKVDSLWVTAARETDGSISWQRVVDGFAALGDTTTPSTPSAPWTASVDTMELTHATAAFSDHKTGPAAQLSVSDILVRLINASTDSTRRIGVEFGAALGAGRVRVTGGVVRSPQAGDFEVDARGLPLPLLQPWVRSAVPVQLAGGAASANGRIRLRTGRPGIVFDGGAGVDGLAINDTSGGPLLSWRALAVRGIHYTKSPNLLRIARVNVEDPFARVAISRDGQLNFSTIMSSTATDTTVRDTTLRDTTAGLPYEILVISVSRARIDFSDQSLILPFRMLIDSANGSIHDVASFGATPGALELHGRVGRAGTALVSGSLIATDPLAASDIQVAIRNLVLPDLTPYSAQYMGYTVASGRLDMDLNYHIAGRQLRAGHHIVTTNLALGPAVEGGDTPDFPVKLALSVMKDPQGRMTLDVPVEGNVDDPQFSYGAQMWNGVKQILRRVATAPFRFLGNTAGISGEDVELVEFEPGRTDLASPERVKLDTLASELARRPGLTIDVEGRYDSAADLAAERTRLLDAKVQARRDSVAARARGDTSSTVLAGILEALYTEQFTQPALNALRAEFTTPPATLDAPRFYAEIRSRLLAAQPVAPDLLERLGRERGAAIAAALLARPGMDPNRVRVTGIAPASRKKAGSPRVASEMKLNMP